MCITREETMQVLADNYCYFLKSLQFDNDIYMKGMGEARTKFLANSHITILKEYLPKRYTDRRYSADYVSERALDLLLQGKWGDSELQYDHMVPKTMYIRTKCEEAAKHGFISSDFIYNLLIKYLWVATIHQDENTLLTQHKLKNKMPNGWDKVNIFARYDKVGIKLIKHDKGYMYLP